MDEVVIEESCLEFRIYVGLPPGLIPGDIGCFGIKRLAHKTDITSAWYDDQVRERLLHELELMSVKIVDEIMEKMPSAKRY